MRAQSAEHRTHHCPRGRRARWAWLALLLAGAAITASGAASAAVPVPEDPCTDADAAAQATGKPFKVYRRGGYKLRTTGMPCLALRQQLARGSQFLDLPDDAEVTFARQAAREDAAYLQSLLRAAGYYRVETTHRVLMATEADPNDSEQQSALSGARVAVVTFTVRPGPRYTLNALRYVLADASPLDTPLPGTEFFQLQEGAPLQAGPVLADTRRLEERIRADNCLTRVSVSHRATLDHLDHTGDVYFVPALGERATFGTVEITGLDTVREEHARRFIRWEEGACFQSRAFNDTRRAMLDTGLFSSITFTTGDVDPATERAPITVAVNERKHRTIKAGAGYATDIGASVNGGWEHRNFRGGGERLTADGLLGQKQQTLSGRYALPYFLRNDQTLAFNARLANEDLDAYEATSASAGVELSRPLSDTVRGGLGITYQLSDVTQLGRQDLYAVLGFPARLELDTRNDLLDPTRGVYLTGEAGPYIDTLGINTTFIKARATGTTYLPLPGSYQPVLALRASAGTITGVSANAVPPDLRFYAGGGGSVRGYGFQELGPLQDGKPIGGKALLEGTAELRIRPWENIGLVTFVDAGNVYRTTYPDATDYDDIGLAAGIGARYFTAIGPVRFDVATPINRRDNDEWFQLYVSIGQAF